MATKEQQHPFYKPLWRRVLIVAVVAAWTVFEYVTGADGLWLALAGGMLAYSVYIFFITWPKDEPKGDDPPPA